MKRHFINTIEILKFNWKNLILFETIYRLFGLAIIFPLANQLLYISVKLSGYEYLINSNLKEYLTSPYTIFIGIVMFLIIGIYITYEIVVLSILFHSSYYKQRIGIYTLVVSSFKKLKAVISKYHIIIIFTSLIFLFIVEGLHLVGIASTREIPTIIYDELFSSQWFYTRIVIIIIIIFYLFFETMFFEIQCTIESTTVRNNFTHSKNILKKKRSILFFEFIIVNFVLNLLFYVAYFLIIGLVGFFLFIFKDDNVVYPLILTLLYTIYLVIGFVATIVLIPVNFAWINIWYYGNKTTIDFQTQNELKSIMDNRPFSNKVVRRIVTIFSLILFIVVIFVFTSISNNPAHLELFNTPTVISHRGGGEYAPENTVGGIIKGIELGADAVEIDVQFTSDGIPILLHDFTLGRTTNDTLNRRVDSLTLEEIKQFDAGSWFSDEFIGEEIPTLIEAIEVINYNVEIFIEIKTSYSDSDEIIVKIIEDASIESHVKILSFDSNLLREIKLLNDKIETVLLLNSFVGDINTLIDIEYIDHYGFNYSIVSDNKEYIRLLQQSGKGVYVWTANKKTVIIDMIKLNVDGIITDYPVITRELVYSDSLKSEFTQLLEKVFTRDR